MSSYIPLAIPVDQLHRYIDYTSLPSQLVDQLGIADTVCLLKTDSEVLGIAVMSALTVLYLHAFSYQKLKVLTELVHFIDNLRNRQ